MAEPYVIYSMTEPPQCCVNPAIDYEKLKILNKFEQIRSGYDKHSIIPNELVELISEEIRRDEIMNRDAILPSMSVRDVLKYTNRERTNYAIIPFKVVPDVSRSIKKVIFNEPATIVIWTDGSKTVVKATDEPFDKEKGLAMAISKRVLGDKGAYYNVIKKWCK